jgi:SAM-dependent methyltransferase
MFNILQFSKSNAAIFSRVYRNRMWGVGQNNTLYSGDGNTPERISHYINGVRGFLSRYPDSTVVDLGCGDFLAASQICDLVTKYIGCDVVDEVIKQNRQRYTFRNVTFHTLDAGKQELPDGDIVIIKQVLQHLSNQQISLILDHIRKFPIWIICEHIPVGKFTPNEDMKTGEDIRSSLCKSGVVLTEPPFSITPSKTEILSEIECNHGTPYHGFIRTLAYYHFDYQRAPFRPSGG